MPSSRRTSRSTHFRRLRKIKVSKRVLRPCVLAAVAGSLIWISKGIAETWDAGGGASTLWSTATNWNTDAVPAAGANLIFSSAGAKATLDANHTVGTLTFNGTGDFTIDQANNAQLTINSGITVTLPNRTVRNFTISAPILLGGNNLWDIGNSAQGGTLGNVTISGGIGETGGSRSLTKMGFSTLILTAAGTYTGATTINNGTLNLANNSATLASSDVILNGGTYSTFTITNTATTDNTSVTRAASVTLNGGEFKVTGAAGFHTTDVVTGALTIGSGPSIVTADANNRRTVIQAGSLQRTSTTGYTIFRGDNLGATAANSGGTATESNIMFTTAPSASLFTGGGGAAGTKQISILAWAVGDSSAGSVGSGFVTYDPAKGIRLLDVTTEYAATASGAATGDNVRIAANDTLTTNKTINALLIQGGSTGAGPALTVNSGTTLTVSSGAILFAGTPNAGIAGSGTVNFGDSAVAFLTATNITDVKEFSANLQGAAQTYKYGDANLSITGVISDGAVPTNLVVGQGTLTLGGVNTYTGTTTVVRGRLQVAANAPKGAPGALGNSTSAVILGTGASTENEGISIYLSPGVTFGRDIDARQAQIGNPDSQRYRIGVDTGTATVAPTTTLTMGAVTGTSRRMELVAAASTAMLDFQGVITNSGSASTLLINGSSAGTGTVRLSNPNSSYNTGTTIVNGTLLLGGSVPASGNSPIGTMGLTLYEGATPASAATLQLLTDGSYTFARTVSLAGSATAGDYTAVIGGNAAASSTTFSGSISSASDVKIKNVQVFAKASDTLVTFSGAITDNANATGVVNVEKTGAGTVVLSNSANTYDGTTTVTSGTLLVNGTLASLATPAGVTVNTGGALGGTGTINRAVTVNGTIAPGSPVTGVNFAQLDTGSLILAANSLFAVEIGGTTGGSLYDQLNVTGTVSLSGFLSGSLLDGFNPNVNDTFYLILNDGTDAVTGTFAGLPQGSTIDFGGHDFTISYTANGDGGTTGNDVALVAQVPEPTAAASLLGGLGLLLGWRRRRG